MVLKTVFFFLTAMVVFSRTSPETWTLPTRVRTGWKIVFWACVHNDPHVSCVEGAFGKAFLSGNEPQEFVSGCMQLHGPAQSLQLLVSNSL